MDLASADKAVADTIIDAQDERRPLDERLQPLLQASASGDRAAFRRLYELTNQRMLRIAMRILRDQAAAEDVLQESYVQIWKHASSQRDCSSVSAWLSTIVRHRSIDRLRQMRTENRQVSFDETLDAVERQLTSQSTEHALARELNTTTRSLEHSLRKIDFKARQALLLAYYHGCSHEEIACELDSPLGTVKSWIRRALESIRRDLE